MRFVMGAVVRVQGIVDRILCQFGMQFAPFAVRSLTVVIIYTIGDIARLLDFSDETTGPNRVYTARGQEENITRIDLVTLQHVHDRIVLDTFHIFIRIDLL